MIDRFAQFPRSLAERARTLRFGDIPVLLAHPDWATPAPLMIWLHGRTVHKELDPGRYLRWIRAGIAACAIDLPGHGERGDARLQSPRGTLDVLEQGVGEIDRIVEHLSSPEFERTLDVDRLGIGGMSAGGMITLRRLCEDHPFLCAAVEGTTGWLDGLYHAREAGLHEPAARWTAPHPRERVRALDPMEHLEGFRPIPLLALHSRADAVVPFEGQERFVEALRRRYERAGADPGLVELRTWERTGAPEEHNGFGNAANDAKNAQLEFLRTHLRPVGPAA